MDDSTGFCKGCFRSLQEVAAWPKLSDPQKLEVLERLELRKINGVK